MGVVGGVSPPDRLTIGAWIEEGGRAVQAAVERPAPAGTEPDPIGEPVVQEPATITAARRATWHRFQVGCRPVTRRDLYHVLPSAARTRPHTQFALSVRCRSRGSGAPGRRSAARAPPAAST